MDTKKDYKIEIVKDKNGNVISSKIVYEKKIKIKKENK